MKQRRQITPTSQGADRSMQGSRPLLEPPWGGRAGPKSPPPGFLRKGPMFYRQEAGGVQFSPGDQCRGCDRFPEGGPKLCATVREIRPALQRGLHLEVLYCPDFHPPLGKETAR